jgi:transglutaminase/protease-like cytokinesis protein 3
MTKKTLKEQTGAGNALEQFKTAMSQLSTGLSGGGGSKPSTSSAAPKTADQTAGGQTTAPTGSTKETDRGTPVSNKTPTGGPSKEVGTEDLAKKVKELGLDPKKAAQLLQYYGIKIVSQ